MRKRLVSMAKGSTAVHGAGRMLDAVVPAPGRLCTVLTFHRIETHEPDLYPGLAGLDTVGFERFVDELVGRFQPIRVDELTGALAGRVRLPARSVLVTFDDAYRDFAEVAWPILRDRGVPVVLFVPTSYPDEPANRFWWDELYSAIAASEPDDWRKVGIVATSPEASFRSVRDDIKSMPHDDAMRFVHDTVVELRGPASHEATPERPRVLGWSEIADLVDEGVAVAPHSRTHPMLDQLRPDQLDDEIGGSLLDLQQHIGHERVEPVFAYPAGGHDPRVRDAVERAGFAAAFTTERGLVDVDRSDRLRLPRLNVGRDNTVGAVATESAIRRIGGFARGVRNGRPR
jgi:peptidoglycan/xylan/chitin deacetylase (PgdA/CDA1 family)